VQNKKHPKKMQNICKTKNFIKKNFLKRKKKAKSANCWFISFFIKKTLFAQLLGQQVGGSYWNPQTHLGQQVGGLCKNPQAYPVGGPAAPTCSGRARKGSPGPKQRLALQTSAGLSGHAPWERGF
jgi:hypothetical protein